jgi:hypothetical protein
MQELSLSRLHVNIYKQRKRTEKREKTVVEDKCRGLTSTVSIGMLVDEVGVKEEAMMEVGR